MANKKKAAMFSLSVFRTFLRTGHSKGETFRTGEENGVEDQWGEIVMWRRDSSEEESIFSESFCLLLVHQMSSDPRDRHFL